jgi:hypothetical protein
MCKPKLNHSKPTCTGPVTDKVREHLREHLKNSVPRQQFEQFKKVGRKSWFEVFITKLSRIFGGKRMPL